MLCQSVPAYILMKYNITHSCCIYEYAKKQTAEAILQVSFLRFLLVSQKSHRMLQATLTSKYSCAKRKQIILEDTKDIQKYESEKVIMKFPIIHC